MVTRVWICQAPLAAERSPTCGAEKAPTGYEGGSRKIRTTPEFDEMWFAGKSATPATYKPLLCMQEFSAPLMCLSPQPHVLLAMQKSLRSGLSSTSTRRTLTTSQSRRPA